MTDSPIKREIKPDTTTYPMHEKICETCNHEFSTRLSFLRTCDPCIKKQPKTCDTLGCKRVAISFYCEECKLLRDNERQKEGYVREGWSRDSYLRDKSDYGY